MELLVVVTSIVYRAVVNHTDSVNIVAQTQQIQRCRQSFPSQEIERIGAGAAAPPSTPEPIDM